jgi:transcription initiation factor TFIIH subunit 3
MAALPSNQDLEDDVAGDEAKSLLVVILDCTPYAWGEREIRRKVSDQKRLAQKRSSVGPARLTTDVLPALISLLLAFSSLHRENCAVVIAVAGDEVAIVYPRKGMGDGGAGANHNNRNPKLSMSHMVNDPPEMSGTKIDARAMHDMVSLGITELVLRSTSKASQEADDAKNAVTAETATDATVAVSSGGAVSSTPTRAASGAAVASALSLALCVINRFIIGALGSSTSSAEALLKRSEDDGVIGMIEGRGGKGKDGAGGGQDNENEMRAARGVPSPKVLILQATEDRTKDYNAFMNCTFAAMKGDIVIDGCFFPLGATPVSTSSGPKRETSTFLEQACDRTGGVFIGPQGGAQVEGALTEVLISVFLPSVAARKDLNLPALTEVDFRARCFETGESVDVAHVCNQCLSIFKHKPDEKCPTCGATILNDSQRLKT